MLIFNSLMIICFLTAKISANKNASSKTQTKSVLGTCTRCRLLSNSIVAILKKHDDKSVDDKLPLDSSDFERLRKEVTFTKLWDSFCFNIKAGQNDCRSLVEDNFDAIAKWYENPVIDPSASNAVFQSLCISGLSVCCPDGHYGPDCKACAGHPDGVCSNAGKCAGSGTRVGNGHCMCRKGYAGVACERCENGFYHDSAKNTCLPCDSSCDSTCMRDGPLGCHVCRKGYEWIAEYGCTDIDECDPSKPTPCGANSFCINTDGAYQCYECDPACDGCDGDGPDSCMKCAKGHELKDGSCMNPNPPAILPPPYASRARYVVYTGMVFVACVVSRHNFYLASLIGVCVAIYIAFAERSLETENGKKFDAWLKSLGWNF